MIRRSLEDRLREKQADEEAARAAQASRSWAVPTAHTPLGARVVGALMDARRVVTDPLESQVSSLLLSQAETEPTWYQTKLASKVASDLQQSRALNLIFQSVESSEARRDDRNKDFERNVADVVSQGKSLINRLQRYEADFWNPDLKDLAGRMLRIVHPDSRDPRLMKRFSVEALREMYQRALAARAGQRSASTGLFVRDAERVIIWQIRTMLSEGLSMEEIAEREPWFGPDLEFVRWLRFVKARQAEMAEQLVQGRKRREEHSQGHVEAYGVIVGSIDAIVAYAGMREYPCHNQLVTLQEHLHQVEALAEQLPDIDKYPMAKYKAEQLQAAITDLVSPVARIATVLQPAANVPGISETQRANALNGAISGLSSLLEYAVSAAQSYIEWLSERIAARTPGGGFKRTNFRPSAW